MQVRVCLLPALTIKLVKTLEANSVQLSYIGLVTPYTGQLRFLSDSLRDAGYGEKLQTFIDEDESQEETAEVIAVHTVDAYQGREKVQTCYSFRLTLKEIVIFSAVRSNDEGKVGFLKDWRRMNVALVTRCIHTELNQNRREQNEG